MGEEVRYHKKCPLFGWDIGFGPFKSIPYTESEMNEYCGYDARYDSTVGKCVPTDSFCKSVDVSSIDDDAERQIYCTERTCDYPHRGTENNCEDNFIYCFASTKETCEANPNCEFNPENVFKCSVKGGKGWFSSSMIRKNCGEPKVHTRELCGDGLTYKDFSRRCDVERQ